MLSPEVNEQQKAKSTKQNKQREVSTVARLISADVLSPDERLTFRAPTADLQDQMADWLDAEPGRRHATWQDDAAAPLVWEADGKSYSPTGLARLILEEAAGRTSQVQGPLYWVNEFGQSLVDLAANLPSVEEVPVEVHTSRLTPAMKPLWESLDQAVQALGQDVKLVPRQKALKYYRKRKLCDVGFAAGHLSVYIGGLSVTQHPVGGVVVSGKPRYIHTQVHKPEDIPQVVALLKEAYDKQGD